MTISELDNLLNELDRLEQIERYEAWQHTAYICHILANINRDPKQKSSPFTVNDFMPVKYPGQEEQEIKPQSWQEIKAMMQAFSKRMNQGRGR